MHFRDPEEEETHSETALLALLPDRGEEQGETRDEWVPNGDVLSPLFRFARSKPLLTKDEEQKLGRQMFEACKKMYALVRRLPKDERKSIRLGELKKDGDAKESIYFGKLKVDFTDTFITHRVMQELADRLAPYRWNHSVSKRIRSDARGAKEIADSYSDASKKMVESNLRLVSYVIRQHLSPCRMSFSDKLGEGMIGLMRAVELFDYRKGCKFSTYAIGWIRQAITRAIAEKNLTIRIPVHLGAKKDRLYKESRRREKNINDVKFLQNINLSKGDVENINRIPQEPLAFEDLSREGRGILESIVDTNVVSAEKMALEEERKREVARVSAKLFAALTPKHATVLKLRLGIEGDPLTLEEIGDILGRSRERIRQIQNEGIKKLKFLVRVNPEFGELKDLLRDI